MENAGQVSHYRLSSACTDELADAAASSTGDSISFAVVTPRRVALMLGSAAFLLMAVSATIDVAYNLTGRNAGVLEKLVKAFSADMELNVPNFFSMLMLLVAAGLFGLVAAVHRQTAAPYVWHWTALSLGFAFMAFDEIVSAHEKLIEPMRSVLGAERLGVFYYAWIVPAIALVFVLGIVFLRFWWKLPAPTRAALFIAGCLYLGGAVGMELLGGRHVEIYGKDVAYAVLTTVEESLEFAGLVVLIYGMVGHLSVKVKKVEFVPS